MVRHVCSRPLVAADLLGIVNFQGTYATNATGILAAGGVMALLPAILVFLLLQRIIGGTLIRGR